MLFCFLTYLKRTFNHVKLDVLLLQEEDYLPEEEIGVDDSTFYEMFKLIGAYHKQVWRPHNKFLAMPLLAAAIKPSGLTHEIVDNFIRIPARRRHFETLLSRQPMAVALSTTFLFYEKTIQKITDRVRELSPKSIIILGGPTLLQFPELRRYGDITVLLEGEKALLEILAALKNGGDLQRIPGIEFSRDGKRIETPARPLMDMAEIPFPDWEPLTDGPPGVYPIETQRGCVYKCKFCTDPVYGMGTRLRLHPVWRVMEEIQRNYDRWGIFCYRFSDSTFTFPIKRAEELCRAMIRMRLPLKWSCYGRADNMTPQLAALMAEAGCRCIFFGVESGDEGMLQRMRKDFRLEQVARAVEWTHKTGMGTVGSFFVGYPGETDETAAATEKFISDVGFSLLRVTSFWVDVNAPAWKLKEEYGLEGRGARWRHRTMDSEHAQKLTRGLIHNLLVKNKACLGTDGGIGPLVTMGLEYDEAFKFLRDKGLLVAYRLAKTQGRPLSAFHPAEIKRAQQAYGKALLKMAAKTKRYWDEVPTC